MRLAGLLLALLFLAACRADTAPDRKVAPAAHAAPGTEAAGVGNPEGTTSPVEHEVAGQRIGLLVRADGCSIRSGAEGRDADTLGLDLKPPCYLLTWQSPPPRSSGGSGESDGIPIGDVGDPMAWKYPGAGGVITLAVIGDPISDDLRSSDLYKSRTRQGFHCAASMQGIGLIDGRARLSRKRDHVGVLCLELGAEEKEFWILAHE